MIYGKHLSNVMDPKREGAHVMHSYSSDAVMNGRTNEEWQRHLRWINENVIGPPKATPFYTQEELEKLGMVGIYAPAE